MCFVISLSFSFKKAIRCSCCVDSVIFFTPNPIALTIMNDKLSIIVLFRPLCTISFPSLLCHRIISVYNGYDSYHAFLKACFRCMYLAISWCRYCCTARIFPPLNSLSFSRYSILSAQVGLEILLGSI